MMQNYILASKLGNKLYHFERKLALFLRFCIVQKRNTYCASAHVAEHSVTSCMLPYLCAYHAYLFSTNFKPRVVQIVDHDKKTMSYTQTN